ncbi:meiosis expressed gene 1 protein homolog isoform X1 [Agelaius tricolor]|uniref:meiosis expressed gene 1 protein homolog isoform X1 n=1 Tax=Agelaius tricolor TaxID=9191 RepID=UPI0039F236E3
MPVDRHCELMVTQEEPDLPTCVEEKPSLGESSMSSKEVLNTKDMKMPKVSEVMTEADIKPKSMHRAKIWSDVVENLYRFQQAGYRDEVEYKQVKQVDQALHTQGSLEKPVQCPLSWLPQPALAQTLSLFQGLAHSKGNQGWDLIRRQARLHGSGPGPSQVIVLPKHLLSCLILPTSFLVIFPYLFHPDPSLPVSLVISVNILE